MEHKMQSRLNPEIEQYLNKLVAAEYYSGILYKSMSVYCNMRGLLNLEALFNKYSKEEFEHADKVIEFINDRNGKVELQAIKAVPCEYTDMMALLTTGYEHEVKVTGYYEGLVSKSRSLNDEVTRSFAQKVVDEQREEEVKFADMIALYKSAEVNGCIILDQYHK